MHKYARNVQCYLTAYSSLVLRNFCFTAGPFRIQIPETGMNRPDGPGVNLKLTSTRMLTTGERNYMLHTQKKTKPDLNKAPSKNLRQHRQKKW